MHKPVKKIQKLKCFIENLSFEYHLYFSPEITYQNSVTDVT